jgi:hypothetical protein
MARSRVFRSSPRPFESSTLDEYQSAQCQQNAMKKIRIRGKKARYLHAKSGLSSARTVS